MQFLKISGLPSAAYESLFLLKSRYNFQSETLSKVDRDVFFQIKSWNQNSVWDTTFVGVLSKME